MNQLTRITQQSYRGLEDLADDKEITQRRMEICVPACFFMLGRQTGYLPDGGPVTYDSFIDDLDWNSFDERGWVRPKIGRELRKRYGMNIVSWQINGNQAADDQTIERMVAAGYLSNPREITFFKDVIVGKTPKQVVQAGFPIIIGMLPGFAANTGLHGVLISGWTDDKVVVIDPDERNPVQDYDPEYVERFINPLGGGCTVVLPKEA